MKEMLNTPKKQRLYTAAALAVLLAALGLFVFLNKKEEEDLTHE